MTEAESGDVRIARQIFMNQRELRAGWRFLIYLVLATAIMTALSVGAFFLHLIHRSAGFTPLNGLAQEIIMAVGVFGAALIMGKFEHRSLGVYGLPARGAFRKNFWVGLFWGAVMISAVMLLIYAWGGFSLGHVVLDRAAILRYGGIWAVVFLLTGLNENFMICGYTQFTLASGMRFWPAAILMSAIFGSLHLGNPGEGLVGALSVFAVGIFFFLTLRLTGDLWFSVGMHAAWDWGETYFYSTPDSGLVSPGHLYSSSFHGPAWLTGGSIGPEGSVMCFVVLGAATLLFALLYRRRAAAAVPVAGVSAP